MASNSCLRVNEYESFILSFIVTAEIMGLES